MQLCIFEDNKFEGFYPLSLSRPVYELVVGARTIKHKIVTGIDHNKLVLHCRNYLTELTKLNNPNAKVNELTTDDTIFINGRISSVNDVSGLLEKAIQQENIVFHKDEDVLLAKVKKEKLSEIFSNKLPELIDLNSFNNLPMVSTDVKLYNYIWELITSNKDELFEDIEFFKKNEYFITHLEEFEGVHFLNPENIHIKRNVTVKAGVVIDASNGPVLIDENAIIYPNAVIEGPVYIGKNSKIKAGATIYENVTICDVCKIGGEVEESIILPFTNKQHAGFIGHAYLGSWVNLGADTNCSDLKNNYSTIKVNIKGKTFDTGLQFLGLIMGDHSKTAINTMFNTGTIAGFSSNIFGAGFPNKFIPSFSWGGADGFSTYDLNKSIETAKIVYSRRNKNFTEIDEKLFKTIFNLTENERNG